MLGAAGFASQIPVFLVAPLGGIVADRFNRQRVVIGTQISSMILALIFAILTLTGVVRVWHIFVLAALLGVVNAFDIPARQSFLVDMVGKEDLMNAIALNSSMFNGARIIGPAIAGILVAKIGEGWCFFANARQLHRSDHRLLMMRVERPDASGSSGPALAHLIEGFRFARHTAPIRVAVASAWTGEPGGDALHRAHAGLRRQDSARRSPRPGNSDGCDWRGCTAGSADFGDARPACWDWAAGSHSPAAALASAWCCFHFSRHFWLSAALLLPVGFCMMLEMSSSNTLIQAMVPDHLRGRVMAMYTMMFMGMAPFGSLFAGALAHHLGAPLTVSVGAVACIGAAFSFFFHLPKIRVEARQLIVAQEVAGGEPSVEMTARVVED